MKSIKKKSNMKKWSRNKTEGEYFALETLVFFLFDCLFGWLVGWCTKNENWRGLVTCENCVCVWYRFSFWAKIKVKIRLHIHKHRTRDNINSIKITINLRKGNYSCNQNHCMIAHYLFFMYANLSILIQCNSLNCDK